MEDNANTNTDKLITFGKMALEQGWYEQAREYFEQALALDASNQEAREALAKVETILARQASLEPLKPEVEPASEEMQISHEEEKVHLEAQEERIKIAQRERRWLVGIGAAIAVIMLLIGLYGIKIVVSLVAFVIVIISFLYLVNRQAKLELSMGTPAAEPIQDEPVEPPSEPESTREPVTPPHERVEPLHIERRVEKAKSTELLELTCQNCGAALSVVGESDQFACTYCGTAYEAKRNKGVIAFRQLKEGVEGIKLSTDRVASELAVKRIDREITGIANQHVALAAAAQPIVARLDYLKRTSLWRLFHKQEVQKLEGRLYSIIQEMRDLNEMLERKFKEYEYHMRIASSTTPEHGGPDAFMKWGKQELRACIEGAETIIEILLEKIS